MSEPNVIDQISQAIDEHMRKVYDTIEEMCERMLVTPNSPGVLVTHHGSVRTLGAVDPEGAHAWRFQFPEVTVELSPDVPFGEIHHRHV